MSTRRAILFCAIAVLLQCQPWSVLSASLTPPEGYSLSFTGTITRGLQKYECKSGSWSKTGSSADLLASNNVKLGTYWSSYDQKTKALTYFWTIINSAGAVGESGEQHSGLQATAVTTTQSSSSSISEYLAIVKMHRGAGDAARVAFVSLTETTGGLPPSKILCSSNGATSGVPFSGMFKFYTQDQVPPRVPASLQPQGTFVQTVFLEGKMQYKFVNSKWQYQGVFATISDVAGGTVLGKFGTVAENRGSKLMFKFNNPNGFWLSALQSAPPVQVSSIGCAWQLLRITSSGGYESPLGKYTSALIAATMGGHPPRIAARTDGISYGSPFTGQCCMYA